MLEWRDAQHWDGCRYADAAGSRFMLIPTQKRFQLLREGGHAGWFDTDDLAKAGAEALAARPAKSLRAFTEELRRK